MTSPAEATGCCDSRCGKKSLSFLLRTLTPKTDFDVITSGVYGNNLISEGFLFYPNWFSRGIVFPIYILKSDGNIMTEEEIKSIFKF